MASNPWHDWDRRIIGWFLVALIVLVVLVGDPRGEDPDDAQPKAPSQASPTQLCGSLDAMASVRDQLVDEQAAGSQIATMDELRDAARRAGDVGTRTRGFNDQAAEGLVFFLDIFLALPDQPTTQQLLSAGAPASVTDQAHSDALVSWLNDNCGRPTPPSS